MDKNMEDVVIKVSNVKKYFKVYPDKGKTLKDKILFHKRNRYEVREVLKGISFDVKRGEAIGLIGKNGCGKSTTLKMLTKILRPNEGTIEMKGRVSSLIELGAGFHPDLTGRENIYINASIFGIKAKEVDERLDDIIRFSELEEYIDNPVRTYSSGMYMRLAFAVAINVDADILLIDEILAVGDINFQEKCFAKLKEIKRNGTTIVIVSHAQGQIEKICDRVIWIDEGEIRDEGAPKLICKEYNLVMEGKRVERARKEAEEELEKLRRQQEEEKIKAKEEEERIIREKEEKKKAELDEKKRKKKEEEEGIAREKEEKRIAREKKLKNLTCREICSQCGPDAHREGNWEAQYVRVVMKNEKGEETTEFEYGKKIVIEMEYESKSDDIMGNFIIGITREDWVYCFGSTSQIVSGHYSKLQKKGKVTFVIDRNSLAEAKYYLDVRIKDEKDEVLDNCFSLITFRVKTPKKYGWGTTSMENEWIIQ